MFMLIRIIFEIVRGENDVWKINGYRLSHFLAKVLHPCLKTCHM
jgi:hypothetical protein